MWTYYICILLVMNKSTLDLGKRNIISCKFHVILQKKTSVPTLLSAERREIERRYTKLWENGNICWVHVQSENGAITSKIQSVDDFFSGIFYNVRRWQHSSTYDDHLLYHWKYIFLLYPAISLIIRQKSYHRRVLIIGLYLSSPYQFSGRNNNEMTLMNQLWNTLK